MQRRIEARTYACEDRTVLVDSCTNQRSQVRYDTLVAGGTCLGRTRGQAFQLCLQIGYGPFGTVQLSCLYYVGTFTFN